MSNYNVNNEIKIYSTSNQLYTTPFHSSMCFKANVYTPQNQYILFLIGSTHAPVPCILPAEPLPSASWQLIRALVDARYLMPL